MVGHKKNKPRAIIFGASLSGINALKIVTKTYQIIAFIDNSVEKQGTTVNKIPVFSAAEIPNIPFEKVLIASEFAEKIHQQLLDDYSVNAVNIIELPNRITKSIQFGHDKELRQLSIQILHLICSKLNAENTPYYVDAGTLLGIYRDGALIPWDDDLDLAIPSESIDKVTAIIMSCMDELLELTKESWDLVTYYSEESFGAVQVGDIRGLKLQSKNEASKFPMMDIFVKYINNDVMDYTLASRGFRMPSEHILSLESMEFQGGLIKLPSQPALYLERHYGDWRTPKEDWKMSDIQSATVF